MENLYVRWKINLFAKSQRAAKSKVTSGETGKKKNKLWIADSLQIWREWETQKERRGSLCMCGCEPPLPGKLKRKKSLALKVAKKKLLNSIVCFPQFGVSFLFFAQKLFSPIFHARFFVYLIPLSCSRSPALSLWLRSPALSLSAFCLCQANCQNCHLPSFCPISKTQRKTKIPSKFKSWPFACS